MSELIQVRRKAQITLPQSVRHALDIEEGDFLDAEVKDGAIVLRVKKLVDKEQAWFWTRRWQEGERKADEDIKAGRVKRFKSAADAVKYLEDKA
jgi:AbrB family looped-hinge helix DNA binding protein